MIAAALSRPGGRPTAANQERAPTRDVQLRWQRVHSVQVCCRTDFVAKIAGFWMRSRFEDAPRPPQQARERNYCV